MHSRWNDLNTKEEPRNADCIVNEWENRYSPCTIRIYVHFRTVARGMKQRQKRIPSFTVMVSIIAKILSHFTVTARGSRWTGQRHGWPLPRERGDWSIDSRTHTAHSLRDRVSPLSWSNRLRYYRVPRFETIQTSRARQTTESPVVGIWRATGQKRREEKRQGERGLRGVAALVGTRLGVGSFVSWTLLLARINLLPPPLASPHRPLAAVPSSAIPPLLGKRGV